MCKKFQRRNALIIILIGSILGAFICSECLILNTTASVPRGLWLKLDCLPKKGDFVQVPNIWGKNKPFLKIVAGLHGDLIELDNDGIININGVPFPNSAPLSHDRAGRFLRAFPLPVTLASDEVWLMSDSPFGFDSRYLGTAKLSKCYKAVPLLTF